MNIVNLSRSADWHNKANIIDLQPTEQDRLNQLLKQLGNRVTNYGWYDVSYVI